MKASSKRVNRDPQQMKEKMPPFLLFFFGDLLAICDSTSSQVSDESRAPLSSLSK
jgi:hypothetical protein